MCGTCLVDTLEGGESLEAALRREAFEELRVKVERFCKIGTINDPVEGADISVFVVSGWKGEPTNAAPDEHSEIGWFATEELPISPALDGYGDLIKRAVAESLNDTVPCTKRRHRRTTMKQAHDLVPAALYARVSSDRQDVDLSISAQMRALRDYAGKNGYWVAREYVDEAESGRIANRPPVPQDDR